MEDFPPPKKEIPGSLSPEEVKKLIKLDEIIDSFNKDLDKKDLGVRIEMNDRIVNFQKQLKAKGIEVRDYILWHRLSRSGLVKGIISLFDTPDNDIEKFIMENYVTEDK